MVATQSTLACGRGEDDLPEIKVDIRNWHEAFEFFTNHRSKGLSGCLWSLQNVVYLCCCWRLVAI